MTSIATFLALHQVADAERLIARWRWETAIDLGNSFDTPEEAVRELGAHGAHVWRAAAQTFRPIASCSPYEMSPASGSASDVAETAKPDMKQTSNPARSIIAAESASWHEGSRMQRFSWRAVAMRSRSRAAPDGCGVVPDMSAEVLY